ncbi:MAG: hypothetical protein LBC48_01875, partial [Dysgonamonadaceae bacterium]|nr:hypothetical protein [Dysgonamonadaceae bacterium]
RSFPDKVPVPKGRSQHREERQQLLVSKSEGARLTGMNNNRVNARTVLKGESGGNAADLLNN